MEPIQFARPYCFAEEAKAAAAVVESGWLTGGPRLREFEERIAEIAGAKHAVGVSSWTTGGFLVLHALGLGPGDEVIVPSYTFIASVNVIAHTGATPVFADIDPETWNIDPADVAAKITGRTKVIMPVDQIGLPCDMDAIIGLAKEKGITVVDDAACALSSTNKGRPVGSLADVTVFSLHARKVVTTGEGGMIVTDDGDLAERLRRLRHQGMELSDFQRHGMPSSTVAGFPEVGYNFRITDIQAAVGLAQLDRLDDILARRAAAAERYNAYFQNQPLFRGPLVPEGLSHNWQSYQVMVRGPSGPSREEIMAHLDAAEIPSRVGVMASHLEPPYRAMGAKLPHTEQAAALGLQLPMHPALTEEQQNYIFRVLDNMSERGTA